MVDVIFRIIDLGIIVALGIYAFKRFIIPSVVYALESYKENMRRLRQEHQELQEEQKALTQVIAEGEEHCSALMAKIDIWKARVERAQEDKYKEREQHTQAVKERVAQQAVYYALKSRQMQVAPYVLKELERDAYTYFADERHVQAYIQTIMAHLTKIVP